MVRRFLAAALAAVLFVPPACAGSALGQLKSLARNGSFTALYDGKSSVGRRPPSAVSAPQWDQETLREAKNVLSHGTYSPDGGPILPFTFRFADGGSRTAQSAGLEGFLYAEHDIANTRGRGALEHHVNDYYQYVDALLAPVSWAHDARVRIREIQASTNNPREQYERLMSFVNEYTDALRRGVAASDASAWVRNARIYEIFPRAYNLEGKRAARGNWDAQGKGTFFKDFGERDLLDIKKKGFDTIWVMGIFPIGKRNAFGTGGGSPYSVKDHEGIHPDLGKPEDFRAFVERAHRAGLKVIIDFIPNHTSMDSKLLNEHSDYFIHRPAGEGKPPYGYFEHTDSGSGRKLWVRHGGYDSYGSKAYWEDTAQVDYSNPKMRREMIRIVKKWVSNYGVDGLRVDMAYQVLNAYYGRNWAGEMGGGLPAREFLEELITEVKAQFPGTAFIAEGYDGWDRMSEAGFDLIYGKNNMSRPGGHHGWYDAMRSRDPGWIQESIKRASYLQWQKGGADMLNFIGNHDEASPQRAFGPWMKGSSFLTLLMPGSILFYGSQEIGFDKPNLAREPKSIPFSVPVEVDWENADPEITRFYNHSFETAKWVREALGEPVMEPLPGGGSGWTGYLLKPRTKARGETKAVAVLANPTDRSVSVRFRHRELGIDYSGSLPPYGYEAIPF